MLGKLFESEGTSLMLAKTDRKRQPVCCKSKKITNIKVYLGTDNQLQMLDR